MTPWTAGKPDTWLKVVVKHQLLGYSLALKGELVRVELNLVLVQCLLHLGPESDSASRGPRIVDHGR